MFRIWVPKKIIETLDPLERVMRVKGRYQLRAHKGGKTIRLSPWFDNLIVDNGLNLLAAGAANLGKVYVGTGTAAPANGDTALGALVASTTTVQSATRATNSSSPYELTSNVVLRFAQGAAAGNLTEVGIGPAAGTLFSRALIVDGGGSPTTFPVAADEFLDVAYQLTVYPPLTDSTGTVSITNVGASVAYTSRAANLPSDWYQLNGGTVLAALDTGGSGSFGGVAYSGSIGAITSFPSGSLSSTTGTANDAYSNGTFTRTGTLSWDLNSGNVGGIKSLKYNWGSTSAVSVLDRTNMAFQVEYGTVISKTSSFLLSLGVRLTWARA